MAEDAHVRSRLRFYARFLSRLTVNALLTESMYPIPGESRRSRDQKRAVSVRVWAARAAADGHNIL